MTDVATRSAPFRGARGRWMMLSLAAAGGLLFGAPSQADAQMSARVTAVTDRTESELNLVNSPLGLSECNSSTNIRIKLEQIPEGMASVLDVWVGERGTNCSTQEARDPEAPDCENRTVPNNEINSAAEDLDIPVTDLFDCTDGLGGNFDVYFLAANSTGSTSMVPGSASISVNLDLTRPGAPTNVEGGSGDTQIPVEWELSGGSLEEHRVYVDTGTGGDPCGSGQLVAGEIPSGLTLGATADGGSTRANLNGASLGIEDQAAVAVTAVDEAGNESALSEVVCVERVPTVSYCDEVGCEDDGIHCSAGGTMPGTGSPLVPGAMGALVLGLWLVHRRRS